MATYETVPISKITLNRDSRQRTDLGDLTELSKSIATLGQLQPIIVTADYILVAGERRFTCISELGLPTVDVRIERADISDLELDQIELEENTKRLDLDWRDKTAAYYQYHNNAQVLHGPDWTQDDTANQLGISVKYLSKNLSVARELEKGNKLIQVAPAFSVAYGIWERESQRKGAAEKEKLHALTKSTFKPKLELPDGTSIPVPESSPTSQPEVPLINGDFRSWAPSYDGPRFNLLHCDFPYGIDANKHAQGAGAKFGSYEDSKDIYLQLLEVLQASMDNVVAESAHMIFWFSMNYYASTYRKLREMGWTVNPHPLIWFRSDNSGIIPDPKRSPRQIYETAFFCSRGDRFIVRSKGNCFPAANKKESHHSEKPLGMLEHFLSMAVDETTHMLDPTCGSGNAVWVADKLGAEKVLGIELDEGFHETAVETWKRRMKNG
jgi:ParB/RepB/Spo0J family partition protein